MPTYPFSIPAGVDVFPQSSGNQNIGNFALPLGLLASSGLSTIETTRAWVCWDQASGTPTISGSFNVASLTDGGAGLTTVIFTTSLGNTTYSPMTNSANANGQFQLMMPNIIFTTGVKCTISNTATLNDNKINTVAIMGRP